MASYLKASIERSYAESFLSELERNENQYFFFVAKGTTWANENSPSAYSDTVAAEYQVMNEIVGYKKLNPQNILFALPRYEWTSGTVYDQYDDAVDLFDDTDPAIFYVVTDANHVYKCLGNNGGSQNGSTVKPSQVTTEPFTLSDGYTWKYLATIKEGDLPYELTDYIPIDVASLSSDNETQNQYNAQIEAINGEITRIDVDNTATPGEYPYAFNSVIAGGNTPYPIEVAAFEEITSTTKRVRVTDPTSRDRINLLTNSTPANLVGYVMRVSASQANPAEINNYGVITAVTSSTNEYVFTVENDAVDFVVTPTTTTLRAAVDFLPYIKIVGDGSGAFAFPTMNTDKQITSVDIQINGNGGRNYSKVLVEVTSEVSAGTDHPTLTAVLSPKGGHGSNILKELNVKDIIIIVDIGEEDAEKFITGGSYRQFGIIKNPRLLGGTALLAGQDEPYYRDITLYREDAIPDASHFDGSADNYIIGTDSFALAKVDSIKSAPSSQTNRVTLKTLNSSGRFVTRLDRIRDYTLTVNTSPDFFVGETVTQTVPAGSLITTPSGSGISYGYDISVSATVLNQSSTQLGVRLITDGNFVNGYDIYGQSSQVTGDVSAVAATNGEYVLVTKTSGVKSEIVENTNEVQRLYKVIETGQSYFDLNNTPAYSGLHILELASSVSSQTGFVDITTSPLTQNSFSNGDTVHQGVTGEFGHYARGTVYRWDFVNAAYGVLYLTNVTGRFRDVETYGITGTALEAYVVSKYTLPEIDPTSGEILYINNVRAVTRGTGQTEEFRLRLGF